MPFEKTWKVYAGATDYSGRIYTPVVVDYIVRTLEELRETAGFPNERFANADFIPPARHVDIEYLSGIKAGDYVHLTLDPNPGRSSITYAVRGEVDGTVVFKGSITTVCIDKETEEPIAIPEEFRDGLRTLE